MARQSRAPELAPAPSVATGGSAIRAWVPLDVLRDTMRPFPTFSEIYVEALKALRHEITAALESAST